MNLNESQRGLVALALTTAATKWRELAEAGKGPAPPLAAVLMDQAGDADVLALYFGEADAVTLTGAD